VIIEIVVTEPQKG